MGRKNRVSWQSRLLKLFAGFRLKNLAIFIISRDNITIPIQFFSLGIRFKLKIQETGLNPSTIKVNRAVME